MASGSQFYPNLNRIQPIDPDRQEDKENKKKQSSFYQGRNWEEVEEDDLPLQPDLPKTPPPRTRKTGAGVWADKVLLERANVLFSQLTTLEEKAAQLCFLETEAVYDAALQQQVELLIQTWQFGGVLFHKGEYRREAYLIERYQAVSKTPLFIANDFQHGLSFYLQGQSLSKDVLSEQYYSDLGKAVMVQNRRLGVHIQFDRERNKKKATLNEMQIRAFRKGVRGAQGIVGKEKAEHEHPQESYISSVQGAFPFLHQRGQTLHLTNLSDYQTQETIGFKTLTFFDATKIEKTLLEEELYKAFKQPYDVFLLSLNISDAIRIIAKLVRAGKISEEDFDRHIMKALVIKSIFFKK